MPMIKSTNDYLNKLRHILNQNQMGLMDDDGTAVRIESLYFEWVELEQEQFRDE